ncbi:hypothetical protein B566_EDAN004156 [Ephemera danica]|nr:hypothetical protein B566_EDAN004156 [Ephemera danica]
MVAVIMDFSKFCAGTLLTTTHILTAAHCINSYNFFELYMGSMDYTDINLRISYTTTSKSVHPNFSPNTLNNDVGLLFVSDIYSEYFAGQISVVRLPPLTQENFDFTGSQATATGWGKGDSGGPLHVIESDGNYTQIAVVSFQSSYSCLTYPNGFARIMAFKSYLATNANYVFRSS